VKLIRQKATVTKIDNVFKEQRGGLFSEKNGQLQFLCEVYDINCIARVLYQDTPKIYGILHIDTICKPAVKAEFRIFLFCGKSIYLPNKVVAKFSFLNKRTVNNELSPGRYRLYRDSNRTFNKLMIASVNRNYFASLNGKTHYRLPINIDKEDKYLYQYSFHDQNEVLHHIIYLKSKLYIYSYLSGVWVARRLVQEANPRKGHLFSHQGNCLMVSSLKDGQTIEYNIATKLIEY